MNRFLFILSPPNSGSTALIRLLQTSANTSILKSRKGEGQFVLGAAPFLLYNSLNSKKIIPWRFIKMCWMGSWDTSKNVLVEKTPGNLFRVEELEEWFRPANYIISIRDPYAFSEGLIRRHYKHKSYTWAAQFWIKFARYQKENIELLGRKAVSTRYEDFTDQPAELVRALRKQIDMLDDIDYRRSMKVHSLDGSVERPLTNLNDKQIARLSPEQIAEITRVLSREPELLDYFGYELMD
ncbi:hypothetical protein DDZ18_02390 [Marinicauda salina]|uniref:Sulfotransferase family protein n=2 Tax=Marinicauda salina TaxID=2135793 RepID=A0A2U2BWY0_9PROT|nr:hypothetical protein DDZ18_02390 [Marinicauda salina]